MKANSTDIFRMIQAAVANSNAVIKRFQLGLTWTSCRVTIENNESIGFAMSPQEKSRLLPWPGTIMGQNVFDVSSLLFSWNGFDATLALAACNAVINTHQNKLLNQAEAIQPGKYLNLSVFYYFKSKLKNKKIAIIGRYPSLEMVLDGLDYVVLERCPESGDLPDTAAEIILPQMDWVFLTATSLINKTFSRLTELSQNAVTVLMGPTTPWLTEFAVFDVDFIAGTEPIDIDYAEQVVMEGGGTRLFEGGVQYRVANISAQRLEYLKQQISVTAEQRSSLKDEMDLWFQQGKGARFPKRDELEAIDTKLSQLDTAYKRLWDANN